MFVCLEDTHNYNTHAPRLIVLVRFLAAPSTPSSGLLVCLLALALVATTLALEAMEAQKAVYMHTYIHSRVLVCACM